MQQCIQGERILWHRLRTNLAEIETDGGDYPVIGLIFIFSFAIPHRSKHECLSLDQFQVLIQRTILWPDQPDGETPDYWPAFLGGMTEKEPLERITENSWRELAARLGGDIAEVITAAIAGLPQPV